MRVGGLDIKQSDKDVFVLEGLTRHDEIKNASFRWPRPRNNQIKNKLCVPIICTLHLYVYVYVYCICIPFPPGLCSKGSYQGLCKRKESYVHVHVHAHVHNLSEPIRSSVKGS